MRVFGLDVAIVDGFREMVRLDPPVELAPGDVLDWTFPLDRGDPCTVVIRPSVVADSPAIVTIAPSP